MNKELELVKQQISKPVIDFVVVHLSGGLRNHWSYSDSDSMTDYYHGSGGSEKYLIESLNKDGGAVVQIHTNGGQEEGSEESIKLLKKIDRIAKRTNYINNVKGYNKVFERFVSNGQLIEKSEYVIEGTFVRKEGV